MKLALFIPCTPAGQPRARATTIAGSARMFNPTTIGKKGSRKPHPGLAFKAAVQGRVRAYWKTVSNTPNAVHLHDSLLSPIDRAALDAFSLAKDCPACVVNRPAW